MPQSIKKDEFLINNPEAVKMSFTRVCAEDLGKMMSDARFFIHAYALKNNEYRVICHV